MLLIQWEGSASSHSLSPHALLLYSQTYFVKRYCFCIQLSVGCNLSIHWHPNLEVPAPRMLKVYQAASGLGWVQWGLGRDFGET